MAGRRGCRSGGSSALTTWRRTSASRSRSCPGCPRDAAPPVGGAVPDQRARARALVHDAASTSGSSGRSSTAGSTASSRSRRAPRRHGSALPEQRMAPVRLPLLERLRRAALRAPRGRRSHRCGWLFGLRGLGRRVERLRRGDVRPARASTASISATGRRPSSTSRTEALTCMTRTSSSTGDDRDVATSGVSSAIAISMGALQRVQASASGPQPRRRRARRWRRSR